MFCLIYGTRPEFIKLSPIIRELDKRRIKYFTIHTGQHYDENMSKVFFDELKMPLPTYNLKWEGRKIADIIQILRREQPDDVIVLGDTDSTVYGALAANNLRIPLVHIEAGIRSFDGIREELNRFIVDHLSQLLLAPTQVAMNNLLKEGLSGQVLVGNPIVDAVKYNLITTPAVEDYILVTLHRPENVDNDNIYEIMEALKYLNRTIIFPCHPRTRRMLKNTQYEYLVSEPVGYLEFLQLESRAKLIITDSGGVQEEACILNVPCITLRQATERPETVNIGANILCGTWDLDTKSRMVRPSWKQPYGDEPTERIVDCLESQFLSLR